MMNCIRPGDRISRATTRDYHSAGGISFSWRRTGEEAHHHNHNKEEEEEEEAEYEEEARALLGRLEYQKGNVEAALQVFQGIDIAALAPRIKLSLSTHLLPNHHQRHSSSPALIMSPHAVTLLFEAIFLKAKSLQALGRYTEAAQSCKVILDIVQSALPQGFKLSSPPSESKLHDILNNTVQLLPELCKLASASHDAILAYRKALLYNWNLDILIQQQGSRKSLLFFFFKRFNHAILYIFFFRDGDNKLIEAWKWKHGMIWQTFTRAYRSGGTPKYALGSRKPSTLILLQGGIPQLVIGLYYKARGEQKEALDSFGKALEVEPNHIPSMISSSQKLPDGCITHRPNKPFGLVQYKDEATGKLTSEAAECFQAATFLQDSAPVEPFFFFLLP